MDNFRVKNEIFCSINSYSVNMTVKRTDKKDFVLPETLALKNSRKQTGRNRWPFRHMEKGESVFIPYKVAKRDIVHGAIRGFVRRQYNAQFSCYQKPKGCLIVCRAVHNE